jgi:DNA modification methylase
MKDKPKEKAVSAPKPAKPGKPVGAKAPEPTRSAAPAPVKAKEAVTITAAKGRPMLTWVGKRPLRHVTAFPAQHVETFGLADPKLSALNPDLWADWPAEYPKGGLLFHGDNKEVLAHLLANGFRGKVNLVYIDPPFDSGADYVRKVSLRGPGGVAKLSGELYSLGEQIQYTDIWANDNYLQFMFERLSLLKELMAETGSIWLHCDPAQGHYLKCIMDEVFGSGQFINEVVWKRSDAHSDAGQGAKHFGAIHDMVLLFAKGDSYTWNDIFLPLPQSTIDKWYRHVEPETGRRYNKADATGPGGAVKGNPFYDWKGMTRAWRFSKKRMEELDQHGMLVYSETGMPYLKRYLDESKGVPLQDWWDDIQMVRGFQRKGDSHYPTEKPEELIERVLAVSSNLGDVVLDCFLGSGTTAAVAQRLGRRWIGCDINKGAIQTTTQRLQTLITEQIAIAQKASQQPELLADSQPSTTISQPAALSFTVHRVNDYDLAVQHNEAVNLACEHIGITRTRGDSFFDGNQGQRLAKIIPFGHPLSLADLDDLKRELESRPDEERDVVVVCLGKELTVEAWLADWNRLRQRGDVPNKIEIIELRTDSKYGKFIAHQPAQAKIKIARVGGNLAIQVTDFISPSILERLQQQAGLLKPRIDDWRAMVDCVMIDPTYDGKVFNIALADVPERKTDFVQGRYELPAPKAQTTVAVKITDMLGEEVLVTKEV